MAADGELRVLEKLGKYEIEAELGSGAMGVVYKARDPRLGRAVAVKTMSLNVASNPDLKKRFYREAQAAGQLRHPNIVTIYDIDEADGIPFIAMEFLEGEDLEKIISETRKVPLARKLEIVAQICKGLHYAHQRGIVHRDIKPGNIMVLDDGQVKIVDFGIARIGDAGMTNTGMVLGTVLYMSPEQIRAQTVDARSDIFSVGTMLYELLTYRVPFAGPDVPAIIMKILNEAPEPLANYVPNCPPELETAILHALEKDREKRYQTAEDLAFDLQRVATGMQRDMVEVYLKQGQRSLEAQDLTLAKESLQKVLEADSGHTLARNLLEQVQAQIQTRQRTQKIEQFLREAKEAIMAESYDAAVSSLEEALKLDPEHGEAQQYREMALERAARKKKLSLHMERAERMAAEANFQAAKTELEAVLAVDRNHAAALHMMDWVTKELTEQERLRHVRQHIQSARSHLAEKNFAQALELLDKARELDPINIEVESLTRLVQSSQEKEERRQVLARYLGEIQEALNREEFEKALGLADQTLREFPDDAQAARLHAQAIYRADIHKKRRYVDEQLQAARDFLEKNEYGSAAAVLEGALEAVPDDARVVSFLKTVQEAREAAALEQLRRQAVRDANESILAGNFAACIQTLEKALAAAGQSPELADLLSFARERQTEHEKQERLNQALSRAQACLREENYDGAIAVLDELLRLHPENAQALEYRRLALERREHLEKIERQMENAEQLAAAGDLAGAKVAVEAVLALDRGHTEAQQLLDRLTREMAERERQRQVEQHIQMARSSLAERDFAGALGLLDQAAQLDPVNLEVESLRRLVEASREKEERRQVLQQHLAKIQEALQGEDFDQALDLTDKALQEFPDDPQVLKLHTQAMSRVDIRKKRSYVDEQLQASRDFLQKNEFPSALALLARALETMPDDPRLASFMKTVEEARDVANRENLRRETIRQANELILAKNFSGAIEALEKSLAAAGQSAELAELLDFVRVQQREEQQQERLRLILGRAQTSLREEDYEEAVRILERAQGEVRAAEIDDLLATARRQLEELAERRQKMLSEALASLQAGEPAKAVALLDAAPKVHFKDQEFQRVYAQCREGLERANFIRRVLEQFDKGIAQEDLGQAEAVLQQALETFPDDPALRDSQKRLREEQLRRRQRQLAAVMDEARVAMGRMDFPRAIQLLNFVTAQARDLPPVVSEAKTLLEEAQRREQESSGRLSRLRIAPALRRAAARATTVPPPPAVKKRPMDLSLWIGAGVAVLALVAVTLWYSHMRAPVVPVVPAVGYVELDAVPWAQVVSVETSQGNKLNKSGETPLRLELPPGDYVVELRGGQDKAAGKVNVSVKAGEVSTIQYTFPGVKVNDLVEQTLSSQP